MKKITKILILTSTLVGAFALARWSMIKFNHAVEKSDVLTKEVQGLTDQLKTIEQKKADELALVEFTLTAMDMEPKTKLSDAKKHNIAEKLARFVVQYIPTQDARESYVAMVKIESGFDNTLRSPVGAVGIGQIMPSTFNATIKLMDTGARPEDITNEDINLQVGAYYFATLLEEQKGNPRLASVAYNGGSKTADKLRHLADINSESGSYGLKTDLVKDHVKEQIGAKK